MEVVNTETDKAVTTPPAGATAARGKADDALTILAPSDSLHGRLVIDGNGQVLGTFSGEIECSGELLIGPSAQVAADIRTRNVVVSGLVRGNVVAVGRLVITATGRLEGDARIGALIVQEGGVHHGGVHVHPEGVPEEPAATVGQAPVAGARGMPAGGAEAAGPVAARVQVQAGVDRVKRFWGEFF